VQRCLIWLSKYIAFLMSNMGYEKKKKTTKKQVRSLEYK